MKITITILNVLLILMLVAFRTNHAQDSTNIILLSKNIGLVVDVDEKIFFNILPKIKTGFISAIYYADADSLFYCKIRLKDGVESKDSTIGLTYSSILSTAYRVQYRENEFNGRNNFQIEDMNLKLANNKNLKDLIPNNFEKKINNYKKEQQFTIPFYPSKSKDTLHVEIIKINRDVIRGDLLYVKDSLMHVLVSGEKGEVNEEAISLKDINSVKELKESKVLSYMGNGFLIGAGFGALVGFGSGNDKSGFISFSAEEKALISGVIFGVIGGVVGFAVGLGASQDKEYIIKDLDDLQYFNKYSKLYQNIPKINKAVNSKTLNGNKKQKRPEERTNRRVGISFIAASTSRGPAEQIENQMIKSSFNDPTHNFFSNSLIHSPSSNTGFGALGNPWLISMKYYYSKRFSFGAFYSGNTIGYTSGYSDEHGYFFLNYSVNTIAAMTWFKYGVFNLGAGPSLFFTETKSDDYLTENISERTKLGITLELAITYPSFSAFYITGLLQYRLVGETKIGPFNNGLFGGHIEIFPSTNVCYNHLFFGIGVGLRL